MFWYSPLLLASFVLSIKAWYPWGEAASTGGYEPTTYPDLESTTYPNSEPWRTNYPTTNYPNNGELATSVNENIVYNSPVEERRIEEPVKNKFHCNLSFDSSTGFDIPEGKTWIDYNLTEAVTNVTCSDKKAVLDGSSVLWFIIAKERIFFTEPSLTPMMWIQTKCLSDGQPAVKIDNKWIELTHDKSIGCDYYGPYENLEKYSARNPEVYTKWSPELVL